MITWVRLGPLLALPAIVLAALCALPTMTLRGRLLGGGPLREWLLNQCVLPLLSTDHATTTVTWFAHATVLGEWSMAAWVAVNLNALILIPLYVIGMMLIRVSGWLAVTDLEQKRRLARR